MATDSNDSAVVEGARLRLRPILMTSLAFILGCVPMAIATGPGAVSRFHIGLVVASGLGIGTLFTLYVVPAVCRTRPPLSEGSPVRV